VRLEVAIEDIVVPEAGRLVTSEGQSHPPVALAQVDHRVAGSVVIPRAEQVDGGDVRRNEKLEDVGDGRHFENYRILRVD